jgi:hypothetical protein
VTTLEQALRRVPMAVWVVLGCCGSVGLALSGTQLGAVANPAHADWWFSLPPGGPTLLRVSFYAAAFVLIGAWLGLGLSARRGGLGVRTAWVVLLVWGLPLFFGPPLFSRDIYSYIAQGLIAHHGHDPYALAPSSLGAGPLLSSVASVWRDTVAPYGPLFVGASRGVAAVSGGSLVAQVLAFRALELIGVVLVMVSLPRLARQLGTDPGVALWLGALSPLALFSYVASGHNDALMVGLVLAGVTLALRGRFALGLLLCALATTIKLPAGAAIVFLTVVQWREAPVSRRARPVAVAVGVTALTVGAVTVASGLGWAWLGPDILKIPTELRIQATPAVSIGVFVYQVLHLLHVPVVQHAAVTVVQDVVGVAALAATGALAVTATRANVVRVLGIALIVLVVGSPTVWPWYLMWGLSLLAATTAQRSRVLVATAAFAMLAVSAGGAPELAGNAYLVVTLAAVATTVWLLRRRRWRRVVLGPVA